MKTRGIASKNSAECEAVQNRLSTFNSGKLLLNSSPRFYWGPALEPLLRACLWQTWPLFAGSSPFPRVGRFHAQWRLFWGLTRTDGLLIRRRRQNPPVCRQRQRAACWRRGRAAGGNAARPAPPFLDKCCKLDESGPKGGNKKSLSNLFTVSLVPILYVNNYSSPWPDSTVHGDSSLISSEWNN